MTSINTPLPSAPESDSDLRRIYGEHAQFSRIGAFTLVHLDSPSDSVIAQRVAEFDADDFFFDDCPLCVAAKADGGHIVFDGTEGDDTEDSQDGYTALLVGDGVTVRIPMLDPWSDTDTPDGDHYFTLRGTVAELSPDGRAFRFAYEDHIDGLPHEERSVWLRTEWIVS